MASLLRSPTCIAVRNRVQALGRVRGVAPRAYRRRHRRTKGRYAFVFGNFRRLHRMGLIACHYRAAEWGHKDIEAGGARAAAVPGQLAQIGHPRPGTDHGTITRAGFAACFGCVKSHDQMYSTDPTAEQASTCDALWPRSLAFRVPNPGAKSGWAMFLRAPQHQHNRRSMRRRLFTSLAAATAVAASVLITSGAAACGRARAARRRPAPRARVSRPIRIRRDAVRVDDTKYKIVITLRGVGKQVYDCVGTTWTFREPVAGLFNSARPSGRDPRRDPGRGSVLVELRRIEGRRNH